MHVLKDSEIKTIDRIFKSGGALCGDDHHSLWVIAVGLREEFHGFRYAQRRGTHSVFGLLLWAVEQNDLTRFRKLVDLAIEYAAK